MSPRQVNYINAFRLYTLRNCLEVLKMLIKMPAASIARIVFMIIEKSKLESMNTKMK